MMRIFTRHLVMANNVKRILDEAIASDVIITAGNGVEIPSHRNFLISRSPVFQRMLQGDFKESKSGRISMDDISEEGVRAFLRFLYLGEVIPQGESIDLAYEILYAAHKYDVSDLEHIMKFCLLKRNDNDFGASSAFKIYAFVRGLNDGKQLRDKMVRIMLANYADVKKLPEFKEVFKNPEDAFELCNNIAEVKPPLQNPQVGHEILVRGPMGNTVMVLRPNVSS